MNRRIGFILMMAPGWAACGSDRQEPRAVLDGGVEEPRREQDAPVDVDGVDTVAPPGQRAAGVACIFSADCPDGLHCDLGECIQRCHENAPCETGATCSPRGRCLSDADADRDPIPTADHAGTVRTERSLVRLTDADTTLTIPLWTDSADPVRYRVAVDAPFLAVGQTRGEFTGATTLDLNVDASGLEGGTFPGSVRIFTNLGELLVKTPMRVGLTGTYRGSLVYEGAGVRLGNAQIVLHVFERWGEVLVQVDHEKSLLFPPPDGDATSEPRATTGRGVYTLSEGVSFTLRQVFDDAVGGERNHFGRPIGRELRFHLDTDANGGLSGTFEDDVHGIFVQPVRLTGTVQLQHGPLQGESAPESTPDVVLPAPALDEVLEAGTYFPGWGDAECLRAAAAAAEQAQLDDKEIVSYARALDLMYHEPLLALLASPSLGSTQTLGDVADLCEDELARAPSPAPVTCALPAALACGLAGIVNAALTSPAAATTFSDLYAHTIDPALLVAQEHIVRGTKASFTEGPNRHVAAMTRARGVLAPIGHWALDPAVLEYLRRTAKRSSPKDPGGAPAHHQSLEVLSRLFYVLATLDAEAARVAVADRTETRDERLRRAQENAVLALFEAATVAGVLSSWEDDAPAAGGTEFFDVLTRVDQGFTAALEGALVFGVPEGFVPFIFDPRAPGATNVEQVLGSIQSKLDQQAADEAAFVESVREFEANRDALARELEYVRASHEEQILSLCGAGFDVTATDPDFETCGADGTGEVAGLMLAVDLAAQRLIAAESRVRGMADKIAIEERRIEAVRGVRERTMAFIDSAGEQFEALVLAEGTLNAIQKMIEVSSNSQLFNLGAPAGLGLAAAALEVQRAQLNAERQRLQTAQELRIHADNAEVEVLNGMAVIKSLVVDMAQLRVEMQQELITQLQSQVDLVNALDRARRLHAERRLTLARIDESPLNDPTFRLIADRTALQALRSRAEAQRGLYLAARALEYHLNEPLGDALAGAVLNAYNAAELSRLRNCLDSTFNDSRLSLSVPQEYSTEISVRERLGVSGPLFDAVTGQTLDEGEQFRHLLLENENLDGRGGVGVTFSSNLDPGNGLWPSTVCDDRILTVEAQLVGDYLGDDEALVELSLEGGGVLRRCDGEALRNWATSGMAAVQAGVNTFGTVTTPNGSLNGLSVASSLWRIRIPGAAEAPSNADVDFTKLEDIVLRVRHHARPPRVAATPLSLSCLSNIGNGG